MGCSASKQPREAPDDSEQRAAARRAERERNEKLWQHSKTPQGGMGGGYAHHPSNGKGSSYAPPNRPVNTPRGGCGGGYGRMSNGGTPRAYSVGAPTPRGGCGGDYHHAHPRRGPHALRRMGSAYSLGGGDSPRAMTAGAPTPRGGCGGGYRRAASAYGGSRPGSVYGVSPRAYSVGALTPRGGCGGAYRRHGSVEMMSTGLPTPRPHTGRANSYGCQTPQHRA